MTAIAIATLVTSIFALTISILSVIAKPSGTSWWQKFLSFGGTFGLTWSIAYLLGA